MPERRSKMGIAEGASMRARRQHSRREIAGFKLDVRWLLRYGTEFELMQFLRRIEIFDEDPRFVQAVNAYRALKSGRL